MSEPPYLVDPAVRVEALQSALEVYAIRFKEQADRIEALEAALRPYATDFCEGWCKDSPPQAMFDDCSGCRARAALAPEQDK
ncbi:MAG: hypothetical protein ABWY82_05060 [Tardiphaga sp.]